MEKFNMIAGLPRAGSTLLCQVLNSNPNFHSTPTSGVLDVVKTMRSNFSHSVTWKSQNRLDVYDNFRSGLRGFLNGYYGDKDIVFDKSRGWTGNIKLLDEILGNTDSKIIWPYRNPVEVVGSIEAQYQKTFLLENADEASNQMAFSTLERRVDTLIGDGGIVASPVWMLNDAIEMGYGDRIMFIKYYDLTSNTQEVMDKIHAFIGEDKFEYDLNDIKQTTYEFDGFYNYKFPHTIKEGEIKYKQSDYPLMSKYVERINQRFSWLNDLVLKS
jgi:sulfotransferase